MEILDADELLVASEDRLIQQKLGFGLDCFEFQPDSHSSFGKKGVCTFCLPENVV